MCSIGCILYSATASAAHPLITEDTGTVGTGQFQWELTANLGRIGDPVEVRENVLSNVLSFGYRDDVDLIVGLPYVRTKEGTQKSSGLADMELAAKWRLFEEDRFSIAVRPAVSLPTGDEDEGLGGDHAVPSVFGVATLEAEQWNLHWHVGVTYDDQAAASEHKGVYHASLAATWVTSDRLQLVCDLSTETNAEKDATRDPASLVLGAIYSLTPDVDLDLGYRRGLNSAAMDYELLFGLAFRW